MCEAVCWIQQLPRDLNYHLLHYYFDKGPVIRNIKKQTMEEDKNSAVWSSQEG